MKTFVRSASAFMLVVALVQPGIGQVYAQQKVEPSQPNQSSEAEKSLNAARDQLQQAFSSFKDRQLDATREYLDKAKQLLDHSALNSASETVQSEAKKLVDEIESFQQQLAGGEDKQDGSIARFWRRATSFIKREAEQLVHQYVELSQNEKTFKHLLDAKMHLFIAEHDLFVSHDARDAHVELDQVLGDLALAEQEAVTDVQPEVQGLTEQVTALQEKMSAASKSWLDNEVLAHLRNATDELLQAEQTALPETSIQISAIRHQIDGLRKEVETINLRNDYDEIMERMKMIIEKIESE